MGNYKTSEGTCRAVIRLNGLEAERVGPDPPFSLGRGLKLKKELTFLQPDHGAFGAVDLELQFGLAEPG